MSAIGLYQKLFKFSNPGNILVLDDCDSILFDDIALNILKAALDSSKKRYISWNTESRVLANEGVPDRFEFRGSVIMITNIKFDYVRSKNYRITYKRLCLDVTTWILQWIPLETECLDVSRS